ncbi:MAG: CvpA family protein [Chloroflexi bacterium]|nr:CvpA family protein [Chloroflexota bacterium]
MTWLDGAIILVVLWFTYSAFQAGFIRETVTVIAAIIGVVLAGLFYKDLAEDVLAFIDSVNLARLVAFGLIFGATALAGQMLALVLKPTAAIFQLGIFDNLAGAAFGFAKAMVFIQIFLLVFVTYPRWNLDEAIDDSLFGSLLIVDNVAFLAHVLPDEFELSLDAFTDRL